MSRRAAGPSAALVLVSSGAVVVLVAVRPVLAGSPTSWSGEELARVACWALSIGCAAWLAITALACGVALARADVAGAWRAARFAPRVVQRIVRTALVGAVAVAPLTPETVPPPRPVTLHAGADGRLTPGRTRALPPSTTSTTRPVPAARPSRPAPAPRHQAPVVRARVHVVRPGDNLWSIARSEVARATQDDPNNRVIAAYWRRVIADNRATLRSGDPSLIFPGEIVSLPNP